MHVVDEVNNDTSFEGGRIQPLLSDGRGPKKYVCETTRFSEQNEFFYNIFHLFCEYLVEIIWVINAVGFRFQLGRKDILYLFCLTYVSRWNIVMEVQ